MSFKKSASSTATFVIDGRELTAMAREAFDLIQLDGIGWGRRAWQADRTPPDPVGWHWLGEATNGEHLFWMPMPAEPAADPSWIPEDR